jgi:type II secretory pathway pseudopilin PulG
MLEHIQQLDIVTTAVSRPACARRNHAFTLMEMVVITAILMVLAAAVAPRVIAYERSRQVKQLEANVARLPQEAVIESIKSQIPVQLQIQGTQLVMEHVPTDGSQPDVVKTIELDDTLDATNAKLNNTNTDTASWAWSAYPDGTADTGGLQFSEDNQPKSLQIASDGSSTWISGALPDASLDQWTVGQLSQLTQSTGSTTRATAGGSFSTGARTP